MTACFTSYSSIHNIKISENIKEIHRDRINSCIEQLRIILEEEFQQESNSKLEKADILEMTVNFLRQQLQLSWQLLPTPLHQAHYAAGQQEQQRPHV